MQIKIAILIVLSFSISSCTSRPEAIAPVSISALEYKGLPCGETQQTLSQERTRLASLSSKQNGAATGDALGVLLLGLPVAKILGQDVEGEIALSKGKVQALERAVPINCREEKE
jgi:hypothetical protein